MNKEIKDKIGGRVLEGYGISTDKQKDEARVAAPPRQTDVWAPAYGKTPRRSAVDWRDKYPSVKTPSVLTAKPDHELLGCQELPWPRKDLAVYKPKDWDKLTEVIANRLLDVIEGSGCVVAKQVAPEAMPRALIKAWLDEFLPDNFVHADPFDLQRRSISVEGK